MKFMILSKLNSMLTRSIIFRLHAYIGSKANKIIFPLSLLARSTLQAFNTFSTMTKSKCLAETDIDMPDV